ncbi:MAG: glycosyltransferase [Candidatus Moraniibacteriota bacterium]|nr:MAG: glycosyltransferase [Candidatus Moranbacteria bacterium]
MKVALVHDYLVQHGGAERVLEAFLEIFPEAPIFTLLYDPEAMRGRFGGRTIYTSFLQKLPWTRKNHRLFPPLMPLAIEQFDFRGFDLVLSDSSSYAKGVITGPETLHISYMHTPMRYAWDDCHKYVEDFGFPRFIKRLVPFLMSPIRLWDGISASRPDAIIANSRFVANRIKKYYGREATVIHPPVETNIFVPLSPHERQDFFLMVGRLIAYKRHDIAIRAFNELKLPLKIIGRGPEYDRLRRLAGPTIEFLGRVPDSELPRYYGSCRAFVFPQEEDFGIVAFEAFAAGRPLIAYRGGDIPEHLEEGTMGIFFERQTPASLIEAVRKFEENRVDPERIREQALRFDRERFLEKIRAYVDREYRNFREKSAAKEEC